MRSRPARLSIEQLEDRSVPAITYHGGAILSAPDLEPVFLGRDWGAAPNVAEVASLTTYLQYLATGPYFDLLNEYQVGRGSLAGSGAIDGSLGAGQIVSDVAIENLLSRDINRGLVPPPDANRLYVVYTEPSVLVSLNGQLSNKGFYGYHNSFTDASGRDITYAVIVNPAGNGDAPGLTDFQTLTETTSHEVAESATDPNGDAWYETGSGNEVADLAEGYVGLMNGYALTGLWSQQHNAVVMLTDMQPYLAPSGQPAPLLVTDNLSEVASIITNSPEALDDFVANAYQQYLNRAPDAEGLSYWASQLQQGLTDEQLEADFLATPEYFAVHGGTNSSWVAAIYQDLLGRTAQAAEVSYWVGQLSAGVSPAQVAFSFTAGAEHEGMIIQSDYSTLLGRTAGTSEVSHWVGVFESGASNEAVVTAILSSEEYYTNPHKGDSNAAAWVNSVYLDVLHRTPSSSEIQGWLTILD